MSDLLRPQGFGLGAVLLAAGASSRMGQPKLLLPWGDTSVLGHLLAVWRSLQARKITVVCPPGVHPLGRELDRLEFPSVDRIVNPTPEQGMFSSIRRAAGWAAWPPEISHCALVLGDQPHLPLATLRQLLDFVRAHPERICQPSYSGRGRHPVVFPVELFRAIATTPEATLKEYLAARPALTERCPLDDPALDLDLDTPSDYARALEFFPPRSTR